MKSPATSSSLFLAMLVAAWSLSASAQTTIIRNGVPVVIPSGRPATPPGGTPSPSKPSSGKEGGVWIPSEPLTSNDSTNKEDLIPLSFHGANIDMVVEWLAKTTGKTVVKHPQVQCQLNIVSSKEVSKREAINIVYRALALEGFSVIESSKSILIVPEGKEPRMSPELLTGSHEKIPEGRELLAKVFSLKHVQAAEIKDKIKAALSDKATVELDNRANQIIITDYNDNLRVVGELIAALDTDKPEDVGIRVIALKNMSAQDLAKELAPLYQKMNSKSPQETIDVAADDRSNSLIVLSSEATFDALEKIISLLDTSDAQDKIMETFLLKNADAQDVAKQLQDLGQNQTSNSRYPYYIFTSSPQSGSDKKMSIVADKRRNAVIVQAPPAQMDSIKKLIHELDAPVADDSLAPRIYHLKYVSAVDIEDVLNELFLKKQQSRSYWDYYFGDYDSSSSGNQDVGRLYGKVRITSEPYSNTIIVTSNSKENLAVVEDVLKQLDAPSEAGESTLRIGLKFAKAFTVANSLNILFAKNGSPPLRPVTPQGPANQNNSQQQQQQQNAASQSGFGLEQETKQEGYYPWLGGQPDNYRGSDNRSTTQPVSDLVGRVRAVADERSNSLLISANVHYFPQILKLIDELDAPTDQVLIEARIVEVSSDFLDKLGVRWSPDGSQFTADDLDNAILANTSGQYQQGFGGTTRVNTPNDNTLAQALTSLRSGVLSSTINMDFLIQFLRKTADATVLGDPQITINDNEMGKLFVGQRVPTLTGQVNPSVGGSSSSFVYQDVGVILEVTPHINDTGDVQLKIHAESSTVVPGVTVLGGAVFDSRAFKTDLTAKNGETLVLGGIIQKQISNTLRKTPILGDIPGLGWAFKKKDKSTHEVELMVFLRPHVIRTPEDAKGVLDEIDQQAPQLKKWREDPDSGKSTKP